MDHCWNDIYRVKPKQLEKTSVCSPTVVDDKISHSFVSLPAFTTACNAMKSDEVTMQENVTAFSIRQTFRYP